MRPIVSIIIPFYNCSYIDQAVQSALNQTYSPIEVIVVDDGSTRHAERLAPYLPYINYLGKANGGTASALNHGIRNAAGEYIAWLSSDDLFYPDKINRQVSFMMEQHARISHTNFNYIDSGGNVTQYDVAPLSVVTNPVDFYRCFLNANPVNGCTVMIKKELFQTVGLFDENLPYTHDLDFWFRAIRSGAHFPFLNATLTAYRWHEGMGTLRHQEKIQVEYEQTQSRGRGFMLEILARTNM
ncbi:glycosyltransferase [Paenibacillus sp. M1]|uniref:Glycosyltransferase n=1 Tax=Paenibacillus haidiansis TaxID=1574488 RepID=A0ABU7VVZ2_9BACL